MPVVIRTCPKCGGVFDKEYVNVCEECRGHICPYCGICACKLTEQELKKAKESWEKEKIRVTIHNLLEISRYGFFVTSGRPTQDYIFRGINPEQKITKTLPATNPGIVCVGYVFDGKELFFLTDCISNDIMGVGANSMVTFAVFQITEKWEESFQVYAYGNAEIIRRGDSSFQGYYDRLKMKYPQFKGQEDNWERWEEEIIVMKSPKIRKVTYDEFLEDETKEYG